MVNKRTKFAKNLCSVLFRSNDLNSVSLNTILKVKS